MNIQEWRSLNTNLISLLHFILKKMKLNYSLELLWEYSVLFAFSWRKTIHF